jgi:hypothetical protein
MTCPYKGVGPGLCACGATCCHQISFGRWERSECSHRCMSGGVDTCNTTSGTIAAIVHLQYLYRVSTMKLGLSLNSNSNPLFEYLLNQVLISTCKEASNFFNTSEAI